MTSKFSLYDFIAVLIPGLLFIWAVSSFSNLVGISINISLTGGLAETSVLIALAYVTGLLLQGISQGITEKILTRIWGGFPSARWLLQEDNTLSKSYKEKIFQLIQNKFNIAVESAQSRDERMKKNQEIFYLCYNAVDKAKMSERPQLFNAQYGLFRCLLTSFCLLLLLGILILIASKPGGSGKALWLSSFSLVGTIISYFRAKKRGEDFAKSIYDLFIVGFSE
jgi:hypothetical protein